MKITQKHWSTLFITNYNESEYLKIEVAASISNCRIIKEDTRLVIAGTTSLTAQKQLNIFKASLA
jgi:hypothetical protein